MDIDDLERKEMLKYDTGTPVELKQQPGKVYIVAEYDPMMVPPVWLVNDPMPHYTYELKLMANLFCSLEFAQAA